MNLESGAALERTRTLGFLAIVAAVCAAGSMLGSRLSASAEPHLLATGLTIDLIAAIPLAFYFLVARPRHWPVTSTIPVFLASLLVARLILPAEYQSTLNIAGLLAIPLELCVLAWILHRARRSFPALRQVGAWDQTRLAEVAGAELGSRRAGQLLATEVAVVYFGLWAWRKEAQVPAGARAISTHERANQGAIVAALLMATLAETLAVHVVLSHFWSATAAWVFTALSLYGALWLIADYRASVLQPSFALNGRLYLRFGLRWRGVLSLDSIRTIATQRPGGDGERPVRGVHTVLLGSATHWIVLTEPAALQGPYGFEREVDWLGVSFDAAQDAAWLDAAIQH